MLYCRYIPWGYPEWQMKPRFSCLQSKPSINGDTGPYDSSTLLQNSTAKHFVQDAHDSIVPLLCLCLVARQSWPQTTCELVLVTGNASGPAFFFTGKLCYQFSLLSVLDSLPTVYISWWICVGWFCFQEFSTWFASSNFLFCDCYGHLLQVVPTCICTQVSSSTSPPYPLRQGLSMNLEFTGFSQVDRPVSWVSLSIPCAEVRGTGSHTLCFYMKIWVQVLLLLLQTLQFVLIATSHAIIYPFFYLQSSNTKLTVCEFCVCGC